MQDLSLTSGQEILVLLDAHHADVHEPAGNMWFPPEFYEYFTLEQ
jgi:hypothetical protein